MKTPSPLLLKEKGAVVTEGRTDRGSQNDGARFFSFFHLIQIRCALLDGTAPDRTGRGLAMAHHYRTINHYHTTGTGIEAPPHTGGSLLP